MFVKEVAVVGDTWNWLGLTCLAIPTVTHAESATGLNSGFNINLNSAYSILEL